MRIGIFGKKRQKPEQLDAIFNILKNSGLKFYALPEFKAHLQSNFGEQWAFLHPLDADDMTIDLAISMGGDGSFLKTAALIGNRNIPILGVNTGRLGFLAETNAGNLGEMLTDITLGNTKTEHRMVLSIHSNSLDATCNKNAINEIAILKQDSAAMLTIHAEIDGEYLNSYQADGLIVATPTGSTAYALSVGGSIISPDTEGIMLVPVAPHSLNVRPLVIGSHSVLSLRVESRNGHYLASIDGRSSVLSVEDVVEIRKADFSVQLIKQKGSTFYRTLREKLMWGADLRGEK